jgi:hypothetical protein
MTYYLKRVLIEILYIRFSKVKLIDKISEYTFLSLPFFEFKPIVMRVFIPRAKIDHTIDIKSPLVIHKADKKTNNKLSSGIELTSNAQRGIWGANRLVAKPIPKCAKAGIILDYKILIIKINRPIFKEFLFILNFKKLCRLGFYY